MVNPKKDLAIAILLTFCLTATLFMIVPTRSQVGQYDPWADINGDGIIDIYDLRSVAALFDTSGDPTKYVNVTNWPTLRTTQLFKAAEDATVDAYGAWSSGEIPVDGYSKVTINIYMNQSTNEFKLWSWDSGPYFLLDSSYNFSYYLVKTYDVPNRYIVVNIFNHAASAASLWVDVYLVA
jgi:hypothetical protein